jgi:hypothetical protein
MRKRTATLWEQSQDSCEPSTRQPERPRTSDPMSRSRRNGRRLTGMKPRPASAMHSAANPRTSPRGPLQDSGRCGRGTSANPSPPNRSANAKQHEQHSHGVDREPTSVAICGPQNRTDNTSEKARGSSHSPAQHRGEAFPGSAGAGPKKSACNSVAGDLEAGVKSGAPGAALEEVGSKETAASDACQTAVVKDKHIGVPFTILTGVYAARMHYFLPTWSIKHARASLLNWGNLFVSLYISSVYFTFQNICPACISI